MKLNLFPSLLLVSASQSYAQDEREAALIRHLLKASNRKKSQSRSETQQDEGAVLKTCYYNLLSSSNYDFILSQSDFLRFVDLQSDGIGVTTPWGTIVSSFNQLSNTFVGIYNQYACGDAYVGCPSIEGIEIESVYDLEDGFLGRFCGSIAEAVAEYRVELGLDADENEQTEDATEKTQSISFSYQIENTVGFDAFSIQTGSNPSNTIKETLLAGMTVVVKDVIESEFGEDITFVDGSARIETVKDVDCTTRIDNLVCQIILTTVDIIVMRNQTKQHIEQAFLDGITEALDDGDVIFPLESGLILVNKAGAATGNNSVSDVPNVGFKPSEGGLGGFPGLGIEEESPDVKWKVPMLAIASVIVFVVPLVFAVVRKSHRDDSNQLIKNTKDDDLFIGELIENDGSLKRSGDRANGNNPAGDIEQGSSTCSSSDPSNPFSVVLPKHSSNSSTSSSPENSPGNTINTNDDGEFASMVHDANNEPFSLQSVASSSMNETMSPNLTITPHTITPSSSSDVMVYEQSGSSCDSLDSHTKTRLSLDNYDDWLSKTAENEDELSKSDVSLLSEVISDGIAPIFPPEKTNNDTEQSSTPIVANGKRKLLQHPSGNCSTIDEGKPCDGDASEIASTGNCSAVASAVAAIEDSSADLSHMTIDGASSTEASVISSTTLVEAPRMLLTHIGAAFNNIKSNRHNAKPRPIFEFSTSPKESDQDISRYLDSDSLDEIKNDLSSAIHAGDWTTVSATALLLAKADPTSADLADMQSSTISQESSVMSSITDLDQLVHLGDWKGVLMAVSQYTESPKQCT